jgi:hypothetical protein
LGTVKVDSSGTLNPGSYTVSGSGTFNLRKDGTLKIGSADGISSSGSTGNIQTAVRNFSSSANYEYNGTTAQLTGNGLPATVGGLTINLSNNLTLSNNIEVTENLSVISGLIILNSYNLTLSATSAISGTPSNTNMVVATGTGQMRKRFTSAGSFTFPVGDTTGTAEYSPVSLNFTSGTFSSAYAGVNVVNAKHPHNSSVSNFINRYWTVNSSGISDFLCDVICNFTDADIQTGADESKIFMGKYSNDKWTLLNPADAALNELSGTVSGFSDFTGGESDAVPVELVSFNAAVENNSVELSWITATEMNNYGFEVERSTDNGTFIKIGFMSGTGNSNSAKHYSFSDDDITNGNYYYRLKQIDNNGSFTYSNIVNVTVDFTPNSFALSQNYPNPFNPSTKISWQSPIAGWQTLKVYDILGNEVATLVNEFREAGFYEVDFSANGGSASGRNAYSLTSGVYIYKINVGDPESSSGQGFSETKKMLLTK